jgi:hypothetical protein
MIAYCLAGHTRGFDVTPSYPNKLHLEFSPFDVFISTWENQGSDLTFWQGGIEMYSPVNVDTMIKVYSPVDIKVEKREDYINFENLNIKFDRSPVNVLNTLLMFKKIKQSIEMVDESYNTVIRSRFDIEFMTLPENIECEEGVIYGRRSPINGLPSDVLFFGTRSTMKKCVPDENFYTENIIKNSINAEDVFDKWMKFNSIEFREHPQISYTLKGIRY